MLSYLTYIVYPKLCTLNCVPYIMYTLQYKLFIFILDSYDFGFGEVGPTNIYRSIQEFKGQLL